MRGSYKLYDTAMRLVFKTCLTIIINGRSVSVEDNGMVIVTKFGGTSVNDAESVSKIIDIMRKDGRRRIMVVSAPAGLTDTLLGFAEKNYKMSVVPEKTCVAQMEAVRKKFTSTADNYKIGSGFLDSLYAGLEKDLRSKGNRSKEEYRDAIAVFGERINAKLVAEIMRSAYGLKSRFVSAEDMGMRTDSQFGNAALDESSPALISRYFGKIPDDEICVVAGYYGIDGAGRPVTFGRDGSNYVAAVIASAIKAELLENYSDKKGICRANPKLVPDAENDIIPELTFEEARELAYSGAKILHPLTIVPLAKAGVPVRVRSTFDYSHQGTLIHSNAGGGQVKGVAEKDMYMLKLGKIGMNETRGYVARLSEMLREAGIDIHFLSASIDSVACAFTSPLMKSDDSISEKFKALMKRIKNDPLLSPDACELKNVTVICVVGNGIQRMAGVASGLQAVLEKETVLFGHNASDSNIIYIVPPENSNSAVMALYKAVKQINKKMDGEK